MPTRSTKLIENFMNTDRGTFWYTDQDRTNESTYCYWPQAHAMDVLIDAYLRIPEGDARRDTYAGYMSKWYENKGNNYGNSYWELTVSAMPTPTTRVDHPDADPHVRATGVQKYLAAARKTYEETVIARWTEDENGGGIRWSFDAENSKNACSNGPGALCAMRLWANSPKGAERDQYLADAKKIYNWLSSTLYNPLTGAVSDNMKNGVINGGALTYNQGTFMGAAHELYKATGDAKYMTDAARAALP
ncbi:MAG: glycoside hydrolase family 76 protein [Alistipes finegoldii]